MGTDASLWPLAVVHLPHCGAALLMCNFADSRERHCPKNDALRFFLPCLRYDHKEADSLLGMAAGSRPKMVVHCSGSVHAIPFLALSALSHYYGACCSTMDHIYCSLQASRPCCEPSAHGCLFAAHKKLYTPLSVLTSREFEFVPSSLGSVDLLVEIGTCGGLGWRAVTWLQLSL